MVYVKKLRVAALAVLLLTAAGVLFGADTSQNDGSQNDGSSMIARGREQFGNSKYQQALLTFRDVVLNPSWDNVHGSAYYWIGRSYMAMGKPSKALENLDFFLENYPDHELHSDGMYQKGRLLIHRGNHQKAIKLLYSFTDTYQEHPYRGNAFFWIGEALYSLGHFEEARRLFTTVVQDYPRSYKVEAARYRLSLIDFKKRERELLKLLRISHEEYLKALEQFRRQEKEYEHAISSYQRRLAAAVSEDDNALISELNREIEEQRSTIQQLSRENEELRRELSDLRGAEEQQRDEQQEPLPAEEQKPEEEEAAAEELTKKTDRELLEDLLELKSEALSQKADYLRQLRNREGDS